MRSVALLLFELHLAFAVRHMLQYYHTVVSGNTTIPEFTAVGLVNDQQFMYFDSNTRKVVPKTDWIRRNEGADYWDRETQIAIGHYQEHKSNMYIIMEKFNQHMSGVHTLQVMFGCELDDDGTTQGYLQYGYDGEDFLSFDKNTLTWISVNPQTVSFKNKWDADRAQSEYWKAYLEYECIEWLKKYVSYGKKTLERKDAPEVFLLQKNSSSPGICHATGFYPKDITMSWKKNNKDHYEDVEVSETLPNADGSYQKSISLSVNPEEWKKNPDVYRCVIQHVAAEKEIVLLNENNNIKTNSASDNTITLTVGCVMTLAALAAMFGLIVWIRSRGYVKASDADLDADSDAALYAASQLPERRRKRKLKRKN